jgi:hypothetical protein
VNDLNDFLFAEQRRRQRRPALGPFGWSVNKGSGMVASIRDTASVFDVFQEQQTAQRELARATCLVSAGLFEEDADDRSAMGELLAKVDRLVAWMASDFSTTMVDAADLPGHLCGLLSRQSPSPEAKTQLARYIRFLGRHASNLREQSAASGQARERADAN